MRRTALVLFALAWPAATQALDSAAFDISAEARGWQQVRDSDGVKIYTKAIPGSPVFGLRADGIIDAPVERVAMVMLNHDRAKEWVDRLVDEHVVKHAGPFEYEEYNHFKLPFPFSDRDYLTRVVMRVDPAATSLSLDSASVDDPDGPVADAVRGQIQSAYLLTPLEGKAKTRLQVLYLMDPKGSVPTWIVNIFEKDWPVSTYQGIRRQAKRPDLTEPERFKAVFDGLRGKDAGR